MSGAFSADFGPDFDASRAGVFVQLIFDEGFENRPRLRHPLWRRYAFPTTQVGLLLFQDGRVIQTLTFETPLFNQADDYTAGGHVGRWDVDSWQARVLVNAGYTLDTVLPPEPTGRRAYGEGSYGKGPYG